MDENVEKKENEKTHTKYDPRHANLKHFIKGVVANPTGRPRDYKSLTRTIKDTLEQEMNLGVHPITGETNVRLKVKDYIVLAMVRRALRGDMDAIKTIFERVDGKVPMPMEHTGITLQWAAMVEYIKEPARLLTEL